MLKINKEALKNPETHLHKGISRSDGGLTFVYCKNGKRIEMAKRVFSLLGEPEYIKVLFQENYLIISPATADDGNVVKDMHGRKVVYNAPLIAEIFKNFNISLEETQCCISFGRFEEVENLENALAFDMKV